MNREDNRITRRRLLPDDIFFQWLHRPDGTRLRMARAGALGKGTAGTALIIPGRTEFIEKYTETIADLREKGFSVAVLDMRGHGKSSRPLANRHKHYLTDFSPMVADVAHFIRAAKEEGLPRPHILLAHSMGAHVALRFAHDEPQAVNGLIASAPMIRIRFQPLTEGAVRLLAWTACATGFGTEYALGQGDWRAGAQRDRLMDLLTSDAQRFADETWQLQQMPDLQLGGVTWAWLKAAIRSCDTLRERDYGQAIMTPTRFILAGADKVVDNAAAKRLARHMPHADVMEIAGARHELMREADPYRDTFFAAFYEAVRDFS